ncbi:serine hydrolase domain-containing protein [Peribacillus glennii]|uniref:Class A beta-lactamase-related serine hydrolase n=1 Tax=Peribacillus glennii TaxID=2303991 RepID=A0A372LAT3_9BACI|nr:serine hydrolase domain-containing protein [Peribacillus glennii]RFU62409.1 class A beta-lactamase-related serine hydrolase [Peribacillus glennii]
MGYVNEIQNLAAKGLYPRKDNLVYVGITRNGNREFHAFGKFPEMVHPSEALFEIGSITKVFTGILLARLVFEGKVSLDDPIEKFKPEYKQAINVNGQSMTLRHLATHTAGLPREDKALRKKIKDKKNPYKYYLVEDLDAFFREYQLKKAGKWNYSNIGVALLARIMEDLLEMPLEVAIEEYVCRPLGLKDTVMSLSEDREQRRVKAFTKKQEEIPLLEIHGIKGAGGLLSTMQDMMRFTEANLGIFNTDLSPVLEFSHKKQANVKKNFEMGLCWFIEHTKDLMHPIIWTGGTTIGYHTYAGLIKEENTGVVVLSTYHLKFTEILKVLAGKGPVVTDRIGRAVFKSI